MFLTPHQINELIEIIDVNHIKFAAERITDKYLTDVEKRQLDKFGIKTKKKYSTVEEAFKFGMLSEALGKDAEKMTFNQLKASLKSKGFLPLDTREKAALESLEYQAYHEIRGLGNKISSDTQRLMVEVDKKQRREYEKVIEGAAKETIVNRGSVKDMASLIGHKTGDWARDLDRISDFVLHNAHDMGRVAQIRQELGTGAKAYKHVFDQACKTCVKLYLTDGAGSQPKIFLIDELMANGSNIGRKQIDWKPVIGATHPWCRCELEGMPIGQEHEWDDDKKDFRIKLTPRQEKIRSQVKVTINL